jgi:prepilin peptidase CpaA
MMPAMVPNMPQLIADAAALVALAALAAAALGDIASRRIPNPVVAVVALAGLSRQLLAGAPVPALAAAACVLLAAALLWLRGLIGGGDVKLLAASSLLVPAALVPAFLLATALAGGGLAALQLGLRGRIRLPARTSGLAGRVLRCEAWRIRRGAPLPYGVAIAAGAAFALSRPGA